MRPSLIKVRTRVQSRTEKRLLDLEGRPTAVTFKRAVFIGWQEVGPKRRGLNHE